MDTTNSIQMIATASQLYNGKPLRRDDPFSVKTESEADDLCAMGFAVRAPPKPAAEPQPTHLHTADIQAESDSEAAPEARIKRAYHRRDLTAEK